MVKFDFPSREGFWILVPVPVTTEASKVQFSHADMVEDALAYLYEAGRVQPPLYPPGGVGLGCFGFPEARIQVLFKPPPTPPEGLRATG